MTHVRNEGRQDLGCPFGCRQAHRQTQSTRRSVAYYREPEGKAKKREINARRRKSPAPPAPPPPPPPTPLPWPRPILDYVRVAVSVIEGRPVLLVQVVEMLERSLRQHRMVRTRRIDQGVAW